MPAVASVPADLADAVLAAIQGNGWSMPLSASRKFVPNYDLRDLDGLVVTVVPRSVGTTNAARSLLGNEIAIDVAIQRKVSSAAPEQIDPLMDIVQEVFDFLTRLKLTGQSAAWLRIANQPIYAPEHLSEKRLFTSVITVTYIVYR
jgi:hypothetical protein